MKDWLKSYLSFSRTERYGLVALCGLLVLLITIRVSMHLWVHPSFNTDEQKRLETAWQTFKQNNQDNTDDSTNESTGYKNTPGKNGTPLPDTININTADSAILVSLRGIGPVTAHKILTRRNTVGPFTDISQLREVGHFPAATFELLKEHLTVGTPIR